MKTNIKKPKLVSARQMSTEHPDTFYYPEKDILTIKKGDSVKVCNGKERFWVTVEEVIDDTVLGTIDNVLVSTKSLKLGDLILFRKEHIYCVW